MSISCPLTLGCKIIVLKRYMRDISFLPKRNSVLKNIYLLLAVFIITGMSFAQPVKPRLLYSDIIVLPSDSTYNVFYTYKIPLTHLVFEKGADLFLAQYRISLEVLDAQTSKFITRAIKEKNIQVPDYDQTVSPETFSEGLLELNLYPGTYSIIEILYDYKLSKEHKLPPKIIKIDTVKNFISPLIIYDQALNCNDKNSLVLADYGGSLPFDENEYSFIFPVINHGTDSLYIKVIQNKDTIFNSAISGAKSGSFMPVECGGKIMLDINRDSIGYDFFRLDGISNRIKEGGFLIFVSGNDKFSKQEVFRLSCRWINKPRSLRDPETAIKALKFIEKDSVINSLLDADKEDYQNELASYWKKVDPTPQTEFNPLMEEYYLRVDYASRNFTTITGTNGANTDRGKIYIKFGKPTEINRTSDDHGYIIETWTYNDTQRKFVFMDKKGTGDFSLISG
jgi:GWxTD domain-containing protein